VPPFNGDTDQEIIEKVKTGKYNTQTLLASGVSEEGIKFIAYLLTYDHKKRPNAYEALNHEWFKLHNAKSDDMSLAVSALANLKKFKVHEKMVEATISFIVT